ncbi:MULTISPECIES: hypothetical protein [unclassified Sutcliffiella]|uniref:alpha/beta fold hydrolase n=1 Tax=unclassified Sutcliffiella TaxID=2837532 RepID=UPI0030CB576B
MIEIKATLENDLTINTQVNESDKPAVCFLHFSGGTLHMWNGVLPLFEKNYKVVVPDLRGHVQDKKEKLTEELMQRKVPVHGSRADYLAEARSQLVEHKLWNPYFSNYLDSTVAQTEDGRYTSHYLNRVRTAYIQTYWNLAFEDYYKEIQCPVLFLVSKEEKEDPKITHSLLYFQSLVKSSSEVVATKGMHAYVWMQYPKEMGERVKSFIRSVTKNGTSSIG